MDELRDELRKFAEISRNLLNAVDNVVSDDLNVLLDERQKIINSINELDFNQSEFVEICNEYEIKKLEEMLIMRMEEKKLSLRAQIDRFSEHKYANKSYNNQFSVDSIYFNKKL